MLWVSPLRTRSTVTEVGSLSTSAVKRRLLCGTVVVVDWSIRAFTLVGVEDPTVKMSWSRPGVWMRWAFTLNASGNGLIWTEPTIGSASVGGTPADPPTSDLTAKVSDSVDPGALLVTL